MKKIADKYEANIPALKNAVNLLIELTESDGTMKFGSDKKSREGFQAAMQSLEMIKWTIICEATALVRSGKLDELE